jgi:hypothetical protein
LIRLRSAAKCVCDQASCQLNTLFVKSARYADGSISAPVRAREAGGLIEIKRLACAHMGLPGFLRIANTES